MLGTSRSKGGSATSTWLRKKYMMWQGVFERVLLELWYGGEAGMNVCARIRAWYIGESMCLYLGLILGGFKGLGI